MEKRFHDRTQAGRLLAEKLRDYANRHDVIVLALPRGGVPVAYQVAKTLHVPLDVLVVRKLGVPDQPELAMGAIASGGVRVLNEDLLSYYPISAEMIESVAAGEQKELERRERLYRGDRPMPEVKGRTVILVDDGIATGTTMRSAVKALKKLQAASIVVAVPVAPESIRAEYGWLKDHVVFTCLATPERFFAISLWYEEFPQTTDEEVRDLLWRAANEIVTTTTIAGTRPPNSQSNPERL
ncbi:MAG: phosphoribosyltransferase [Acidobacteria bacterium]|nr:phosphoribosyltransferase [Acidobacteriota bacterium]